MNSRLEEGSSLVRKSSNTVDIKGYGSNVNIILNDEADFSDVEAMLIKKLEDSDQFFSGSSVVLDVGKRVVSPEECEKLKGILSGKFNLIISAVRSRSDKTQKAMKKIGWKIESRQQKKEPQDQKKKNDEMLDVRENDNDTVLFKGTLRSGQRKWHKGNIVVIGHVNPGAEVVATGDVVIMGTLRGVAHAGVEGDTSAEIIALDLRPIQLRIAGYIGRSPDLDLGMGNVPEMARVEDGNIVIRKLK